MKRYATAILLLILACACKNNKDSGYHLPPKEMGKLLMDIHMAEAYSSLVKKDSAHLWAPKNYDSLSAYYKDIFAHYHITQEQFDQTMTWYRLHPAQLDTVYEKIVPQVTKLEIKPKAK